jgi:hypothetical protein
MFFLLKFYNLYFYCIELKFMHFTVGGIFIKCILVISAYIHYTRFVLLCQRIYYLIIISNFGVIFQFLNY